MADRKITELANITGADLADGDEFVVVDASADETKAITFGELKSGLDTATGFVRITGDTMTGALDVQSTITADGLTVDGAAVVNGANMNIDNGYGYTWGTNAVQIYSNGSYLRARTSGTDRLTIDSSGNVGIGATSPQQLLHINGGAADTAFQITNSASGSTATDGFSITVENPTPDVVLRNRESSNMRFLTANTERMRIDSSGNVGIGTSSVNKSSSSTALTVNTGTAANYSALELSSGDTLNWHINANNGNVYDVTAGTRNRIFYTNGSERMRIDSSGNVGIGTSSPATPLDVTKAGGGNFVATFQNTTSATPYGVHIKDAASGANGYPLLQVTNSAGSSPYLLVHSGTGNVGIGTSSPTRPFSVVATGNTSSVFERTDGNYVIEMKGNGTTAPAAFGMFTNDLTVLVNNSERMRIDSSGNLLVGKTVNNTFSEGFVAKAAGGANVTSDGGTTLELNRRTSDGDIAAFRKDNTVVGTLSTNAGAFVVKGASTTAPVQLQTHDGNEDIEVDPDGFIKMETAGSERLRIDSAGNTMFRTTDTNPSTNNVEGHAIGATAEFSRSGSNPVDINRVVDGSLIIFRGQGTSEGNVSVSGTTVSYNGGHLSRWSQSTNGARIDGLVKGTVMTNLDQMAVWGDEENEQLNCMAVSSVEGDPNVAGVFVNWDDDDETYMADMNIAMTGDMIIRIAQGTTVERGDLLMSAGDGTAKPQGDDIVRSKTIAKVTSTHVSCTYDDGSYCVPCVLMAC